MVNPLTSALAAVAVLMANPVVEGDHPDPTMLRAQGAYYASATVSAWAPLFPVFRSTDLVNWRQVGSVLATAPPWGAGRFWAPELVRGPRGGFLAYYSASRRDGPPCVGVASATRPAGPYRDRGRAACPAGGAIDAAPIRDERGRPWLAWKALGPGGAIRLQRLRADGLRVRGPSRALVGPDQPWEHGVTEGPAFLRHGGRWFLLYSGGNCCRPPCTYALGAARADSLLGPWEKRPTPILAGDDAFKCPGHGTPVAVPGAGDFLLHHAYRPDDVADARRLMLLSRVDWGADGWPQVNGGAGALPQQPSPLGVAQRPPQRSWSDGFDGVRLPVAWEWLFDRVPATRVHGGALDLGCHARAGRPAFVARQAVVDRFAAVARVVRPRTGWAGLFVHDQGAGLRGIETDGRRVRALAVTRLGEVRLGATSLAPRGGRALSLLVSAVPGGLVGLQVSADGRVWSPVAPGPAASGTPATRVALACHGGGTARFLSARLRAG